MALRDTHVTLAHGGGGKAMRDLIEEVFTSSFEPESMEDQARLTSEALQEPGARLGFTTDSFVVTPVEFPGGDIGKLAICGTVNDLAVGGAQPLWLSAGFIIEEGCEIALLKRIVETMKAEAEKAGVKIVTGDTKVVARGAADKVFINTSGIGVIPSGRDLAATRIQPGDVAIVNGVLGDHGATILAARGDMALSTDLETDCQALNEVMEATIAAAPGLRAARDATRGGLASALNEMAEAADVGIEIDETDLPLRDEVKGMCEILGLDPLYLANEGAMRATEAGRDAVIIGKATEGQPGRVTMRTLFGGTRIVDMLVGEQLPRIC
ncbi:MAG: hydrogenase expression/formation protein HypE [Maritimibacter sp.]